MSRSGRARVLLVDGNNIIHAWSDLLELHRQRRGLAHHELIQRLTAWQDSEDIRVVAVFDGRGKRAEQAGDPAGIQVIYSDTGSTADDVIERLTGKYAATYDLTVATDDRAEQLTVETAGGSWISSETLRIWLENSADSFRKRWLND